MKEAVRFLPEHASSLQVQRKVGPRDSSWVLPLERYKSTTPCGTFGDTSKTLHFLRLLGGGDWKLKAGDEAA